MQSCTHDWFSCYVGKSVQAPGPALIPAPSWPFLAPFSANCYTCGLIDPDACGGCGPGRGTSPIRRPPRVGAPVAPRRIRWVCHVGRPMFDELSGSGPPNQTRGPCLHSVWVMSGPIMMSNLKRGHYRPASKTLSPLVAVPAVRTRASLRGFSPAGDQGCSHPGRASMRHEQGQAGRCDPLSPAAPRCSRRT